MVRGSFSPAGVRRCAPSPWTSASCGWLAQRASSAAGHNFSLCGPVGRGFQETESSHVVWDGNGLANPLKWMQQQARMRYRDSPTILTLDMHCLVPRFGACYSQDPRLPGKTWRYTTYRAHDLGRTSFCPERMDSLLTEMHSGHVAVKHASQRSAYEP